MHCGLGIAIDHLIVVTTIPFCPFNKHYFETITISDFDDDKVTQKFQILYMHLTERVIVNNFYVCTYNNIISVQEMR